MGKWFSEHMRAKGMGRNDANDQKKYWVLCKKSTSTGYRKSTKCDGSQHWENKYSSGI